LNPERANRLVQQKAMDSKALGFDSVLGELISVTFKNSKQSDYQAEIQRSVQFNVLQHLMNVIVSENSIPQSKAIALNALKNISEKLKQDDSVFNRYLNKEISIFENFPKKFKALSVPTIPDGSPIGSFQCIIKYPNS
jgi:hypothetical protein